MVLSATDDHGYVADNSLSIGLEVTSLDPSAPVLFAMRNTDVLSELSKLSVPGTYLIKTKTIDAEGIYSSIIEDAITVIVEENGISDGEISWASWALELVGEVHNYFSFTVSGFDGLYESIDADGNVADIGLLVYNTKLENSSDCTIENADIVISGGTYDYEAGVYRLRSQGIPAKNMGDDAWYKIYVKTKDGYVYSQRLRFSPLVYCIDSVYGKNSNITNDELKAACVALMNYGAAAQEYFAVYNGYEYTELMNSSFR